MATVIVDLRIKVAFINGGFSDDLVEKFRDCLAFSPRPISEQDREFVIQKILHLEEVPDIREILQRLA